VNNRVIAIIALVAAISWQPAQATEVFRTDRPITDRVLIPHHGADWRVIYELELGPVKRGSPLNVQWALQGTNDDMRRACIIVVTALVMHEASTARPLRYLQKPVGDANVCRDEHHYYKASGVPVLADRDYANLTIALWAHARSRNSCFRARQHVTSAKWRKMRAVCKRLRFARRPFFDISDRGYLAAMVWQQ